jgi:hypothetical protein
MESAMNYWLDSTLQNLHLGQALMVGGVGGLVHGLKARATDTLATGADRWQLAIRQLQEAPLNVADILRARTAR